MRRRTSSVGIPLSYEWRPVAQPEAVRERRAAAAPAARDESMLRASVRVCVALLCLSFVVSAQFKDSKHGFSFKPPKDYVAVALSPSDIFTLAKYQDP